MTVLIIIIIIVIINGHRRGSNSTFHLLSWLLFLSLHFPHVLIGYISSLHNNNSVVDSQPASPI